jgi:hypothetical protein
VPRHLASFDAVKAFIVAACQSLEVRDKERRDLELVIEDGTIELFSHAGAKDAGELLRIQIQFQTDRIRITVLAPGRPLDVQHLPVYSPEMAREGLDGSETFLMSREERRRTPLSHGVRQMAAPFL